MAGASHEGDTAPAEDGRPADVVRPSGPSRPDATPQLDETSRRDFLKLGGIATAGAVVGGAIGAAAGATIGHELGVREGSADLGTVPARSEPGFDHIVVLMGENRSFDNLLGRLYSPETLPPGATFDGLEFGDYANTAPSGERIAAHVYEGSTDVIMGSPDPDPGEEYPHVNTQLFGVVDPPGNAAAEIADMRAPFNAPPHGAAPTMDGFATDYRNNLLRLRRGSEPSLDDVSRIMGGFSPAQLPVLSTLAQQFAVFDAWHCAVPSQTYCNRSFFHASTSHGFVTNRDHGGYRKWLEADAAPTVFDRLEDAGLSWKVYFDELQLVSLTGILHSPTLERYWRTDHFVYMSEFYEDAKNGTLPAYAFIEPRLVYNHNDFHPPVGVLRESDVAGEPVIDSAVSDVRAGEKLVADVYDAIRTSATPDGSNAVNTLLLITFDEHGGTYDHVVPPAATPPHADESPGEMGFGFDRLGVRVPAIAVSAYTRAGTIVHDEMHHGALAATLAKRHGLRPLTRRDAEARDMYAVVNLDTPRDPATWPLVHPLYLPPNTAEDERIDLKNGPHSDKPLSPPGKGLLGLLLAKYGSSDDEDPQTYADAYRILQARGLGLFYPKKS
ncbi:twin-arginine translocation signal domain-containing protein [Microbacterium jejuense]|uniref:phospholipase C n=1 Tax=Microbacterium jejuense TaxID=1263637 RepID=A0ABS7HNC3_9MICO|nr:alkaline phosphatase family protein [Microbacterium jejuense]MBW9093910.1 twin-arginine translocation signal domain-containing protein [Microbacterium jejuense]